ncbi:hypothetical protein [Silvibacterium acidisoli]|uniref:hypothetical protein n=1 Tax=Acidobacteriaceae bacterium ZG23-2 TaxID=2883246 RepID=UPI00406CBF0B
MKQAVQAGWKEHGEEGYILIAVLFLVAALLIALAVAAPRMSKAIQRDRELELEHRGEQYKRAIRLYYKKFGSYPASIDQLMNTNDIRFLRKRYTDPMTGKDDWVMIHFGEAHVKPLGLFGQPIASATTLAGATPAAAMGGTSATGMASTFGSSQLSNATSTSTGTSTMGTTGAGMGGGLYASTPDSGDGSTGNTNGTGSSSTGGTSTDSSSSGGSAFGSSSSFGSAGSSSSFSSTTSTTGTSGTSSGFGSTGSSGSGGFGSTGSSGSGGFGSSGSTAGPIVGVKIPSTKASMIEYKKQKHYNQWEFVYDPIEEQLMAGGMLGGGSQNLNGGSATTGLGGSTTSTGTGIGTSSTTGTSSTSTGSSFGSTGGSSFGSTSNSQ